MLHKDGYKDLSLQIKNFRHTEQEISGKESVQMNTFESETCSKIMAFRHPLQ